MAALTITAGNVDWVGGSAPKRVTAGATITRGQVVTRDSATGEYVLADADDSTLVDNLAIALTDGFDGKPMLVAEDKAIINIGATTVAGTVYGLSSSTATGGAAGGVSPVADLGSGDTVRTLFVGSGTGQVTVNIDEAGAAIA